MNPLHNASLDTLKTLKAMSLTAPRDNIHIRRRTSCLTAAIMIDDWRITTLSNNNIWKDMGDEEWCYTIAAQIEDMPLNKLRCGKRKIVYRNSLKAINFRMNCGSQSVNPLFLVSTRVNFKIAVNHHFLVFVTVNFTIAVNTTFLVFVTVNFILIVNPTFLVSVTVNFKTHYVNVVSSS